MTQPASKCRHIVLTGFMGAGKSTVAPLLAARLGWQSADLDQHLCTDTGSSIAEIFSTHGEQHFRSLESAALTRALGSHQPSVLALGGGAIETPAVREALQAGGIRVFYLEAPLAELLARCASHTEGPERPLLGRSEILFERRAALYSAVGTAVSTFGFTAEQVATHILSLLQMENAL